jgi:serine/threonine-protein kinase RsbW
MGSANVIRLISPCTLRHRALAARALAEPRRPPRGDAPHDEQPHGHDLRDPTDAAADPAFAEIYNNPRQHAHGRREGDTIEIAIHVGAGTLTIEIRDNGSTFDPSTVPEPDLDSLPEGGMGLHIARAMLDEVAYEPGPPNLWRLTKRHRTASSAS